MNLNGRACDTFPCLSHAPMGNLSMTNPSIAVDDGHPLLERLTPREREVLELVGRGLTLPEIAERLCRSLKTIESHRLSLGRKLEAGNRVELARIAIAAGLAPLQDPDAAPPDPDAGGRLRDQLASADPAWQALQQLEALTRHTAGPAYFRQFVQHACPLLQADLALVCEILDDGFRILAASTPQSLIDSGRLPASVEPCRHVAEDGFLRVDQGFQERFPDHPALRFIDAQGYVGICLHRADGQPTGLINLLFERPINSDVQLEAILRFIAPRAAAELERINIAEQLRETQESLEDTVAQRTQELQDALREVRARETKYRTLVETMSDGLCAFDQDYRITYVNQRLCDMLHTLPDHMIGRLPTDFMPEEDAAEFLAADDQRQQGTLGQYRLRLKRTDGSTFPVIISPRTLFDEQRRFRGSFGVVTDLSPHL